MTAATKKTALQQLEAAHENLYDVHTLLGSIKITKETADRLEQAFKKTHEADRNITIAIDNLS